MPAAAKSGHSTHPGSDPQPHIRDGARRPRLSFISEQWVPFPASSVFAFFSDPHNLPRLMPAWQDARIDSLELQSPELPSSPSPGSASPQYAANRIAGAGSRILLSFRPVPLSPIRLRWLALIDDYVLNHRFCDLQVTGPFGYWRHCHLVSAEPHAAIDGTRITDVVDYAWAAGPLNPLVDALGGRLQIRQIFRYRQQQLLRLLQNASLS